MHEQILSNKRKTTFLILLFTIFVIALGWIFGELTGSGQLGIIIAVIVSVVMTLFSYFSGDKVALLAAGAKEIKKDDNPYVYRLVENLSITAGLPVPKVHIINDPAPNAFATGRDPKHASVALTTGLIERLENEELEGVIAHELAHIQNYDIRLMMIVIVLLGVVVLLSDWLIRISFYSGRDDRKGGAGAIIIIVGIILAIMSPIFAKLIQLAVSRKREYLADASGSLLTRYPEGLASALEKISVYHQPLRRANNATAHLYINNPFGTTKRFLSGLFSTHPSITERIKALRGMT
ncbi:MAG TPA: M48 family metallopeptidase [Patescibacteria group bacterium]